MITDGYIFPDHRVVKMNGLILQVSRPFRKHEAFLHRAEESSRRSATLVETDQLSTGVQKDHCGEALQGSWFDLGLV